MAGRMRRYVRFAALGDSATCGLGDPTPQGDRGWARILVAAIAQDHDVSFCNLAVPGATAADVRNKQLRAAVEHRPQVASLIVGLNDTLRADFDAGRLRADLLECARLLTGQGATLLTVRFHDHSRVFRLPSVLARPLRQRIAALNEIYDEIHARYGGFRVDRAAHPGVYDREFWSVDRLHPSELGHRALALEYADQLAAHGLDFTGPALELDGTELPRLAELKQLVKEGLPWLGRRARDLAPGLARAVLARPGKVTRAPRPGRESAPTRTPAYRTGLV